MLVGAMGLSPQRVCLPLLARMPLPSSLAAAMQHMGKMVLFLFFEIESVYVRFTPDLRVPCKFGLDTNLHGSKIVEYPEWLVPADLYFFDPVHQYFTTKFLLYANVFVSTFSELPIQTVKL